MILAAFICILCILISVACIFVWLKISNFGKYRCPKCHSRWTTSYKGGDGVFYHYSYRCLSCNDRNVKEFAEKTHQR